MKNMKIFTVCLCLTSLRTLFANTYDYFQLVLTWPPTFCTAASSRGTPCKEPIPQGFILNGFWPSCTLAIFSFYNLVFSLADLKTDPNLGGGMAQFERAG